MPGVRMWRSNAASGNNHDFTPRQIWKAGRTHVRFCCYWSLAATIPSLGTHRTRGHFLSSRPPIPRLRFRPTARADLRECFELLPEWLGLDRGLSDSLPDLWLRLLDEPAITSTLMEDLALPAGQRIQGWGWDLVLPGTWVQQEQLNTCPAAYVIRRICTGVLDGNFKLLSDAEIGAVNAAGRFHFLNFYTQRRKDLDDPYVQSVLISPTKPSVSRPRATTPRLCTSRPVRMTRRRLPPRDSRCGLRQRKFARWTRGECAAGIPERDSRGDTRQFAGHVGEARIRASSSLVSFLCLAATLVVAGPVRRERYLSGGAAGSFDHGLKKLWRGIYERIEHRMPEFFGEASGGDEGRRGPEKRRQVLAYVRQRPEELRAWVEREQ